MIDEKYRLLIDMNWLGHFIRATNLPGSDKLAESILETKHLVNDNAFTLDELAGGIVACIDGWLAGLRHTAQYPTPCTRLEEVLTHLRTQAKNPK